MLGIGNISKSVNLFNVLVEGQGSVLRHLSGQTVSIRPAGTWCVEFFDDSKQWQSLTFKDIRNRSAAQKRLTLFISDRERGQLNLPKKKAIPTLAEFFKKYLELYKGAKERTLASKKSLVSALVRYLGDYRLDKITPFIIEKFRIDYKEKDEVGEGMINNCVATLSHLFSMAIQAGVIAKNPCKNVKRFKSVQTKDRILSESEISLLLNLPQNKDRMMILTGLFTGMRLIEVLSLKWCDIDFARSLISFTQNKTGKAIVLPLSSYIASELMGYKACCTTGDSVFESRQITKGITDKQSGYFSALFKGLGIQGVTFHTLRHTFSSILQSELGIGAVVVQGMTGHSSLGMLQRYSHTGFHNKQRAIQSLTDHVLSIKSGGNNTGLSQTGTA